MSDGEDVSILSPRKRISPDSGRIRPEIVLSSVVLPAPLLPTMVVIAFSLAVIETSERAGDQVVLDRQIAGLKHHGAIASRDRPR